MNNAPTVASWTVPKSESDERQQHEEQRGRSDTDQLRPHARLTAARAEEPGRPHEEHAEDDRERDREPQLAADPVHVGADEVQQDAEDQAADDRTDRRVHAAEHRRGEARRAGPSASCSARGRATVRRARPRRRRAPLRAPSRAASIVATRTPVSRASTGLTAAARRPSPIFVRSKSSPMQAATVTSETPITPRSCFENATPPTWIGAVENGP